MADRTESALVERWNTMKHCIFLEVAVIKEMILRRLAHEAVGVERVSHETKSVLCGHFGDKVTKPRSIDRSFVNWKVSHSVLLRRV